MDAAKFCVCVEWGPSVVVEAPMVSESGVMTRSVGDPSGVQAKVVPISFAERYASSAAFNGIYKEGMALVEETAAYLDGKGRQEAKALKGALMLGYATESMRLTTRLMQLASWLLIRKAVALLIQRDDGQLRDKVVSPASLSASTLSLIQGNRFNPRGLWVTATAYAYLDLIEQGGTAYVCAVGHTAGVFATDYAAGKWQVFNGSPSASGVDFTPAGRIASTNVQAAVAELDTKTAAASNPPLTSLYGGL